MGPLLALLPGCSSVHIHSTRHQAAADTAPFRNVVVIGVDQNPEVREPFENDAVRYLHEHGVEGTASYARFNFDEVKGDKEQLRQKLAAAKAESVLYVRVTQRGDFVEGPPASLGDMDLSAINESQYVAFTTVGNEVKTAFQLGARLYRISDGAVIWSAVVDEVLKEDADSLAFIRRTAKTIVDRMAKDKVIP
jgi:hypothetical protein